MDLKELKILEQWAVFQIKSTSQRHYGFHWKGHAKTYKEIFDLNIKASEKLDMIQNRILYNIDAGLDSDIVDLTYDLWDKYYKNKDVSLSEMDNKFQESPYYQEDSIFVKNGRRYSVDYLHRLNYLLDIDEYCKINEIKSPVLLEIGAGVGHLPYLAKIKFPKCKHILIDLPEGLYAQFIHLRLNFPDQKFVLPTSCDEIIDTINNNEFDVIFIPTSLVDDLLERKINTTIDVAMNTHSFGEMKSNVVKKYMSLLENNFKVNHILLCNRFLNVRIPKLKHRFDEHGGSVHVGSDWEILHWEFDPEFFNFPYIETFHPHELYIIARKSSESKKINIDDIYKQYWCRNFYQGPTDCKCFSQSVRNRSINGTLGRLWNAVRIHPSPTNIDAIIKYIYTIEGRYQAQERQYYMDKFKKMTGKYYSFSAPEGLTGFGHFIENLEEIGKKSSLLTWSLKPLYKKFIMKKARTLSTYQHRKS